MNCSGSSPIHGADLGWAFGCSRRGASHLRGGKPCQDAYALWSGTFLSATQLIAAVADGHGDRQHDLSEIGASIATQVAVQELLSSLPKDALYESDHALEEEFARTFPERVTESWLVRVQEDAKSRLGESYTAVDPEATIRRYGTTLLVTRVSPRWIMLAQIGDGDILFLSLDDRIVYPLETENALVGLSTYSLASRNAISLWKTAVLPREGGLLLLATDGLSDSFGGSDHPEFQRFVRSLRQRIGEYGIGKVAHSLPTWLSQYSDQGSGDDVTLVLMDIMPEESGNNQTVEDTDGTPDRSED